MSMMEMPKPGEAHKKLSQIAGNWTGEEKMYPSQWDPNGGNAKATINNRVSLDGFVVIGDYMQMRDGVCTFSGHSVWTYDAQAKEYALYWFDSMGMGPEVFRGNFEGDKLTVASKGPMGHVRLTYEFPGQNKLRARMDTSQDGQNWKTMFDGNYSK